MFQAKGSTVKIEPSQDSYFEGHNGLTVDFSGSQISHITQLADSAQLDSAAIEPQVVTNLFDSTREKRRVVRFEDLPPVMVHAVLAAEDKRFFEHGALDVVRVFGAAFYDLTRGHKAQGASTIDMQVARTFFLHHQARMAAQGEGNPDGRGDRRALLQAADFRALRQ